MKIYTRTGDKGTTSLFDKRVLKSDLRVETYGTIDELNSLIGAINSNISNLDNNKKELKVVKIELEHIQHDLFEIGSTLAFSVALPLNGLDKRPKQFEKLIDKLDKELPVIRYFILPGGSITSSFLHIARTVTRRSERRIVELMQEEEIDEKILVYVNRLSDLLFAMARYVNHIEKKKEIKWIKK